MAPLCIRLSSGEHLVFPSFKAAKGKVSPVSGYHRLPGGAQGFYGTTIVSSNGSIVGIGLTVSGVAVASSNWNTSTTTTSWNLVSSQAQNARLREGALLTQCGRRDTAFGLELLGCLANAAEIVDCKPPIP